MVVGFVKKFFFIFENANKKNIVPRFVGILFFNIWKKE